MVMKPGKGPIEGFYKPKMFMMLEKGSIGRFYEPE